MKLLFVYSNRTRDLLPAPPVGLSYVASATADAGHHVRFLDLLLSPEGMATLERELRRQRPQVVAISVRNIDNVVYQRLRTHLDEMGRQIALIGRTLETTIVIGGPAVSILGCDALHHIDAELAVLGEDEQSPPALLADLEAGGRGTGIPGVCVRGADPMLAAEPRHAPDFGPSDMPR